jgi:glycosyltransferase involved in cell wall biosynthesis
MLSLPARSVAARLPSRLRIALVAPPAFPIPPAGYAGTERIVAALAEGLHRRGHEVTLFAPGDSRVECRLVPTVPRALWSRSTAPDLREATALTLDRVAAMAAEFDVIHSHLEPEWLELGDHCSTPVVATFHGRLDGLEATEAIRAHPRVPLVAISESQRRWHPEARWMGVVHHGLPFTTRPPVPRRNDLVVVGRASPEKGIAEAIELARISGRRLHVAAKVALDDELAFFDAVMAPAIARGELVFLGEVGTDARDALLAGAAATLMLGAWPEPFGLVAIESLAMGTPVIARRAGALPEIIEHGVDGFIVDDVREARLAAGRLESLDHDLISARTRARFSVDRMVAGYEQVYARLAASSRRDVERSAVRLGPGDRSAHR